MESFYLDLALITAGMAIVSGLINLITGLNKEGERTELIFGILCLCGFMFLILPSGGFILKDNPPYPADLKFKRIFILAYYALLPFFIEYYINYRRSFLSYSILSLMSAIHSTMFLSFKSRSLNPMSMEP